MTNSAKVICMYGPTAAGKTALAIEMVETLNCDIISVDSAMIYRGMDIGTAKPSAAELDRAPHQLIDICDPAESYSAAQFAADAKQAIEASLSAGRTPLLVGGTMLYFKALLEGFSALPESDAAVRSSLQLELEASGSVELHHQLADVDPVSAARIHPNDPQRILRALEVHRLTGKSMTELSRERHGALGYDVLQLAVAPASRAVLHDRIAQRFRSMLEQGFVDEVRALKARGDLHLDLPSMRSVGYRQAWQYLAGELAEAELLERGVIATRQLAKRQLTWLRGWQGVHWLDVEQGNMLAQVKALWQKA